MNFFQKSQNLSNVYPLFSRIFQKISLLVSRVLEIKKKKVGYCFIYQQRVLFDYSIKCCIFIFFMNEVWLLVRNENPVGKLNPIFEPNNNQVMKTKYDFVCVEWWDWSITRGMIGTIKEILMVRFGQISLSIKSPKS